MLIFTIPAALVINYIYSTMLLAYVLVHIAKFMHLELAPPVISSVDD